MEINIDLKEKNYKIEISKLSDDDGGGFLATVPSLPGCISDGETQEEALINIKDAIRSWIETALEMGREIPQEDVYRVESDYSGKLSLRIPKSLHKQVSEIADKEGCSINQLLMMYISMGVGGEFGKRQVNVTFRNENTELPIINQLQRKTWDNYENSRNQSLNLLNLV